MSNVKTQLLSGLKESWNHRYGHVRFRLLDINCLFYMGLIGFLLFFFHKAVTRWLLYVLVHAAIVIAILEIIRLAEKYPQKNILWMFRTFYPIAVLLYGWKELHVLVPMIFGSFWATDIIVQADKLIFGVHPTVWVQKLYRPWLDELMNFFYVGYYTFFLLVPLSLLIRRKREEALTILSLATFAYLTNFLLFYFIPTLGPAWIPMLQESQINEQTGYFFAEINRIVQSHGGIRTAAFPSSHVAGALVWVLSALRYNRKLGYALIPIAVGTSFATVYTGLHHALDPLFGYFWGTICYLIALKLIKRRREDPLAN